MFSCDLVYFFYSKIILLRMTGSDVKLVVIAHVNIFNVDITVCTYKLVCAFLFGNHLTEEDRTRCFAFCASIIQQEKNPVLSSFQL